MYFEPVWRELRIYRQLLTLKDIQELLWYILKCDCIKSILLKRSKSKLLFSFFIFSTKLVITEEGRYFLCYLRISKKMRLYSFILFYSIRAQRECLRRKDPKGLQYRGRKNVTRAGSRTKFQRYKTVRRAQMHSSGWKRSSLQKSRR